LNNCTSKNLICERQCTTLETDSTNAFPDPSIEIHLQRATVRKRYIYTYIHTSIDAWGGGSCMTTMNIYLFCLCFLCALTSIFLSSLYSSSSSSSSSVYLALKPTELRPSHIYTYIHMYRGRTQQCEYQREERTTRELAWTEIGLAWLIEG
jgi:hypothetical protein